MHALADKAVSVPFRDSKLTRLLQPALVGNTRTALIGCVTPALPYREQSVSTLQCARSSFTFSIWTITDYSTNLMLF